MFDNRTRTSFREIASDQIQTMPSDDLRVRWQLAVEEQVENSYEDICKRAAERGLAPPSHEELVNKYLDNRVAAIRAAAGERLHAFIRSAMYQKLVADTPKSLRDSILASIVTTATHWAMTHSEFDETERDYVARTGDFDLGEMSPLEWNAVQQCRAAAGTLAWTLRLSIGMTPSILSDPMRTLGGVFNDLGQDLLHHIARCYPLQNDDNRLVMRSFADVITTHGRGAIRKDDAEIIADLIKAEHAPSFQM